MQDEEAMLYDIVLKRAKRFVISITGENGIEGMGSGWIIGQFTIQQRPWKDWTSFRSHCYPISHILPIPHLPTSYLSAGAKAQCEIVIPSA
jgi:hypothetical protein